MRLQIVSVLTFFFWSGHTLAQAPRVIVDIAPVHGLVARVMDGVGSPELLLPSTASVHSHALRPSEAALLESADIVIWVGEDLSPWLMAPIDSLASEAVVVRLLDTTGTRLLPFREDSGADDDHDHAHDEDAHDPHAWLDPENGALWLDTIAAVLSAADSGNAAVYGANAAEAKAEIAVAVGNVESLLSSPQEIRYAVFHDAYQYFEARFGLMPIGAVTLGDAAPPGPGHLARLEARLKKASTDCLLVEPKETSRLVGSLAGGALRVVQIDPMGADLTLGKEFYPALLSKLAESFDACR